MPVRATRTPPAQRLPRMSEKTLQEAVLHLARLLGYEAFHVYDSRRSACGFPDCCLVRGAGGVGGAVAGQPPRLIFAELKVGRNQLTPAQVRWLARLGAIAGVETFVWREREWQNGEIERILR